MAKAKKKLTISERVETLERRFPNGGGLDVTTLSAFNTKQHHRITALEGAICPRVAARLSALEKGSEADEVHKREAIRLIGELSTTMLSRVAALEHQNSLAVRREGDTFTRLSNLERVFRAMHHVKDAQPTKPDRSQDPALVERIASAINALIINSDVPFKDQPTMWKIKVRRAAQVIIDIVEHP